MAVGAGQHILHIGLGRVGLDNGGGLLGKERLALLAAVGGYALRTGAQAVEYLGKAHLLVADSAVDFLTQAVGTHHIPGAAALGGVPQGFQFKECLVMKVASLVKDNQRLGHALYVVDKVLLHIEQALHIVQTELFGYVADKLILAFHLRAVNVNHVLVAAGVLAGGVGLANASLVAQERPAAVLLAELQLLLNEHIHWREGCFPLFAVAKHHVQLAANVYPLGVGQNAVQLAVLDSVVHARVQSELACVLGSE